MKNSIEYKDSKSRRDFLKHVLAASTLTILPKHLVFGVSGLNGNVQNIAPSEKVNLACCGIGNRGREIINNLYNTGLANIVALCDVDLGAPQTLEIMQKFPNVPMFKDFRQMFDKMESSIDAVSIGIPDFSHFPVTMLAMSLGKHVYVEKPMAHTFRETELMMKAEKKYKVACQMGNQGHSEASYFQFKTWVDAGIIKNVSRITAFMNNSRRWHGMTVNDFLPEQPVPETLDWDNWLSTAPYHPYNQGYINGEWRSWYEFGNGALGDWGAHIIDTAHEFLKLGLPVEVNPIKLEGHNQFIFPQASTLEFKFPAREGMPPVDLAWYDGIQNQPPLPEGFGNAVETENVPPPSNGAATPVKLPPGKIIYGEGLTFKGGSHGSTLQIIPEPAAKGLVNKLPVIPESSSDHYTNFLRACKGQEKCRSSFAVSGPLCQVMVLGVIAQRLNIPIKFDVASKKITNSKFANKLLVGPPPRKGWKEYYKL